MASTTIPTTMKGVIIEKTGGVDVLQYKTDLAVPKPNAGEVLVKNDFIGINYIDTYFRTGQYRAPSFPHVLGREAAGSIVATGSDSAELHGLATGDRIVWMGMYAYADYTAVPVTHATKVPAGLASDVAAAALLQGLTALTLIREAHAVQPGDWVLVHAAAGGVGLWLCQLLKTAVGAHVIGTASTEAKMQLAREHGAELMLDYTRESDFAECVRKVTAGAGVVAVFDGVGQATFNASLDCLARKGSMVSFGNASGPVPPFTISRLSAKNIRLIRPTLYGYIDTREEFDRYTAELFALVEKHNLDVRIHKVYPLADVARAHEELESRKTTGKLLLKP